MKISTLNVELFISPYCEIKYELFASNSIANRTERSTAFIQLPLSLTSDFALSRVCFFQAAA